MIYPTRRAIGVAAVGAPVALIAALLSPGLWQVGAAWVVVLAALLAIDAGMAALSRRLEAEIDAPPSLGVGLPARVGVTVRFPAESRVRKAELALEAESRLTVSPVRTEARVEAGALTTELSITGRRRGAGRLETLWLRWTGPLGLMWSQVRLPVDRPTPVSPNIETVKADAMRMFARDALFGVKAQLDTGAGSEFHALRDFVQGMDRRGVDWKRSARHNRLVAKEFRTERNHQIVVAIDTGRVMSQPLAGLPRIDRAIHAALLLAYVGLKIGDRVGLFGFDARPNLNARASTGPAAFELLQRMAARLDYSANETNYTLGLTALSGELDRRSMIVVFTDFSDSISAELMVENIGRLLRRHVVIFVVFHDEELEAMVRTAPNESMDVTRAVTAAALLREREVVLLRLRRMGVHLLDVSPDQLGPELVNSYLDLKRRVMG